MRRRRELPELTNNHERWLISYADFLTLLFAFFVVMYSTSAINNGSFRVLSDSIVQALGMPGLALTPTREGETGQDAFLKGIPGLDAAPEVLVPLRAAANDLNAPEVTATPPAELTEIEQRFQDSAGDLIDQDQLQLTSDGEWLEILIPANLLFPSGSRALLADATPMLARLAELLVALPNEVIVQGHTDDQPIRNGLFPSNWELSTARAAAVVRVLEAEGISPARLSAQGYSSTRPIASNDSEEGRAENRRVVLVVRDLAGEPSDGQ